MNFDDLMRMMTPEVHANLKRSVELGKWPDGRRLDREQRQSCLQAIIAFEAKNNMPEHLRTGYVASKGCTPKDDAITHEQVLTIQNGGQHD